MVSANELLTATLRASTRKSLEFRVWRYSACFPLLVQIQNSRSPHSRPSLLLGRPWQKHRNKTSIHVNLQSYSKRKKQAQASIRPGSAVSRHQILADRMNLAANTAFTMRSHVAVLPEILLLDFDTLAYRSHKDIRGEVPKWWVSSKNFTPSSSVKWPGNSTSGLCVGTCFLAGLFLGLAFFFEGVSSISPSAALRLLGVAGEAVLVVEALQVLAGS